MKRVYRLGTVAFFTVISCLLCHLVALSFHDWRKVECVTCSPNDPLRQWTTSFQSRCYQASAALIFPSKVETSSTSAEPLMTEICLPNQVLLVKDPNQAKYCYAMARSQPDTICTIGNYNPEYCKCDYSSASKASTAMGVMAAICLAALVFLAHLLAFVKIDYILKWLVPTSIILLVLSIFFIVVILALYNANMRNDLYELRFQWSLLQATFENDTLIAQAKEDMDSKIDSDFVIKKRWNFGIEILALYFALVSLAIYALFLYDRYELKNKKPKKFYTLNNMRRISLRSVCSAIVLSTSFLILIFIVNNLTSRSNDLEIPQYQCNCPKIAEPLVRAEQVILPKPESPTIRQVGAETNAPTTKPLPPCKPVSKDSPVQRAIIIYYPHHQSEYFFPEVRWLFRSWAEMLREQPKTWRTDFLIFTYNFSTEFKQLGCVSRVRQDKEEPSMCRLFLYVPIQFRTKNVTENNYKNAFTHMKNIAAAYNETLDAMVTLPKTDVVEIYDAKRSDLLYTVLRAYGYIDSINTLYEGFHTFNMYDFVLRTDIDVFIYRHFGKYIPENCTLITGGGGYGTDFNRRRLKRVARDMGFEHVGLSGMGSTWYGSPHDGYLVANQTLHGMLWLAQYEFAMPERESKLGTLMWPEWHYGVLLLYGQHLAINHLVGSNEIRIRIGNDLLDQSSTDYNPSYVKNGIRLNLHCWHTNDRFSKFAFKLGQYKQSELEKYRNDTTAQAYAMRMALESKYMTLEQMANLVQSISKSS